MRAAGRGLLVATILTGGILMSGPALAACGMTVGPGENPVSLAAPQSCEGVALLVVGPVDVDLGGQTITCASNDSPNTGIVVLGKGARIKDGKVENCETGVALGGEGEHRLLRVETSDNGEAVKESGGILIVSDGNQLWRVTARDNGEFGVRIDGDRNLVRNSDVSGNVLYGALIFGAGNTLARSTLNGNGRGNVVVSHVRGTRTHFLAGGDDNRILKNHANDSPRGGGIHVSGDSNMVRGNEANGNFTSGIRITREGNGNRIVSNTARGNHTGSQSLQADLGAADLQDDNLDCGDDLWRGNSFVTSRENGLTRDVTSPACIR